MTTSGTYNAAFPIDDLLTESWERIGKSTAIMTGDVAASARRSVVLTLIDWTNRGVPLWQVITQTITTVRGTTSYTLPANIVDVLDAYITVGPDQDRILGRISRSNYAAISDKTVQAPPSQLWINRQAPAIQAVLYPAPDAVYTATLYALRQPQDVSSLAQTADAPFLWSEALAAALTARLAEKYAPDRLKEKLDLAQSAWTAAYGDDRERVPLSIVPDFSGYR